MQQDRTVNRRPNGHSRLWNETVWQAAALGVVGNESARVIVSALAGF